MAITSYETEFCWLLIERNLIPIDAAMELMAEVRQIRGRNEPCDVIELAAARLDKPVAAVADVARNLTMLPIECPACNGVWLRTPTHRTRDLECPQCGGAAHPRLDADDAKPWRKPGGRSRLLDRARRPAPRTDSLSDWVLRQRDVAGYRLIKVIGRTPASMVFRAQRPDDPTPIALKVLTVADPVLQRRLIEEAETLSRVRHPNVVSVIEAGEFERVVYLAMEYLPGQALTATVRDHSPMPFPAAAKILLPVLSGLSAVHEAGIVHRDLKPGNIVLGDPIKLIDFGLMRDRQRGPDNTRLTEAETTVGTPHYIAPEQLVDSRVDQRADLYSAGVILYEMITGVLPHHSETVMDMVSERLVSPPEVPSDLAPGISPVVDDFLGTLLATDPHDRPATADDVIARIEAILS